MKKCLLTALFLGALLAFGGNSWGLTITTPDGTVDVGSVDHVVLNGAVDLANSGKAEKQWLQDTLGFGVTLTPGEGLNASDWYEVSSGIYAFHLQGTPRYFVVKTGNTDPGKKDDPPVSQPTHYLFENSGELDWAVVALAEINILDPLNVEKISHIDEVDGTVPEPGTVMLLGAGLFGLAVYRKRFRNS